MSGQLSPCDIRRCAEERVPFPTDENLKTSHCTRKRLQNQRKDHVMERRAYWKEELEVKKLAWSLMRCERKAQMNKGPGEEYLEEKNSC